MLESLYEQSKVKSKYLSNDLSEAETIQILLDSIIKIFCLKNNSLAITLREKKLVGFIISKSESQTIKEISLNYPSEFSNLTKEKLKIVLDHCWCRINNNDEEISSATIYGKLLGGGNKVTSKVYNPDPAISSGLIKQLEDFSLLKTPQEKISNLNQRINEVKEVLFDWKNTYNKLEIAEKNKILEKTIEVPVEVIRYIEVPRLVEKVYDEKIDELYNQIEKYESKVQHWKSKLNEKNYVDESVLESTKIDESSLYIEEEFDRTTLEIFDKEDNAKLKEIREKFYSLQDLKRELKKSLTNLQTNSDNKIVEIEMPYNKYVTRPIETFVDNEEKANELKLKVDGLNKILKEWHIKYEEFEAKKQEDVIFNKIVEVNINEHKSFPNETINENDSVVLNLQNDLSNLRGILKNWQSKFTNSTVEEKIIEVPVDIIKYVERSQEIIKSDEVKVEKIKNEISNITSIINNWQVQSPVKPQSQKIETNTVSFGQNSEKKLIEDNTISELNSKLLELKNELEAWELTYFELKNKNPKYIEKNVEVKVPVTKQVERQVEKYINDEAAIEVLKNRIESLKKTIPNQQIQKLKGDVKKVYVEKVIEVPVEVIKTVERNIEKRIVNEENIQKLLDELNTMQTSISKLEVDSDFKPEIEFVEKINEVAVERIKYIDEVKIVKIENTEKINQIIEEYNKLQSILSEWQNKYQALNLKEIQYVDKYVEIPYEVIQYIDIPIEVTKTNEEKIIQLTEEYNNLKAELQILKSKTKAKKKVKQTIVDKIIEVPIEKIVYIDTEIIVNKIDNEKIEKLSQHLENLYATIDLLKEQVSKYVDTEYEIIEKIVEIPVDVIEYVDIFKNIKNEKNDKVILLQEELDKLINEIEVVKEKCSILENYEAKEVTKTIEILTEKIEYVDKVVEIIKVDEEKLNKLKEEYLTLENLFNKISERKNNLEFQEIREIEKYVEVEEEIVEKITNIVEIVRIDIEKIENLKQDYQKLYKSIESIKEHIENYKQPKPIINHLTIEIPVEIIKYIDNYVEITNIDEEVINNLTKKYNQLKSELDETQNNIVEALEIETKVVDKKVDVITKKIEYIDYDVEVTKVDEERVKQLANECENLRKGIANLQDQFISRPKNEVKIVNQYIEVPVEIVEYVDVLVDVVKENEIRINELLLEKDFLINKINETKAHISRSLESNDVIIDKIVKKPVQKTESIEKIVEIVQIDEIKIEVLNNEISKINDQIKLISDKCNQLQDTQPEIVEKKFIIPVEKVIYVDKEVNIVKVDQERINNLKNRYEELEAKLKSDVKLQNVKEKKEPIIVQKFVDIIEEKTEYIDIVQEKIEIDEVKITKLTEEYNKLSQEFTDWSGKVIQIQNVKAEVVQKFVGNSRKTCSYTKNC